MAPQLASHGANSGPPLLSGPLEIRTTIYKEVLQGTAFVVDTPLPLCTQAYMRTDTSWQETCPAESPACLEAGQNRSSACVLEHHRASFRLLQFLALAAYEHS